MLLAEKLIKRIGEEGDISIDKIDVIARKKGIDMKVLDQALQYIHKVPHINQRVKKGTVWYSIKVVKEKEAFVQTWAYPWPGQNGIPEFVMPFPSIDFSYMFLTPEEMKLYKAEAKGIPLHMMKKFKKKTV